jgi:hypothetical protein
MAKITDIHIQDKVRFLDSVGEGIVVKIDTKQNLVYVQDEDGFDIPMPAQQIVVIAATPIQHERETTLPSEGDKKSKEEGTAHIAHTAAKGKKEAKKDNILEVDLHIAQLVDHWQHMQRGEILELQLSTFHKTMRNNIKNRGQKIVFIHGKGEGILKAAINKELDKAYPTCQYHDASFAQYGFGATMVIIA